MNRHQRRALKKARASNPIWNHYECLTKPAYQRLKRNLEGFDNQLSEAHERALMCIVGRFTMLASGTSQGRYAYDLPCGGGKTQAVVAWCAELYHRKQPWSVAVCASRVEPLCDLKRHLIKNGVAAEAIGLIHSYKHDLNALGEDGRPPPGYASLPKTTENDTKQILLVTHQKVRGKGGLEVFNTYKAKPRDLVIWDESLIVSDHRAIEKVAVEQGLGYLRPLVSNRRAPTDLGHTMRYLEDAWRIIEAELKEQQDQGRKPKPLTLPEVTAEELDRMLRAIHDREATQAVRALLAVSQSPLRVVTSNQGGGGVIQYDIVVPPELRNVAVLDASWAIRALERLDKTIQDDPRFDGNVKTYNSVTLHQLRAASGREAMTKAFSRRREDRKVSQEIVETVKTIPGDQGILMFTFKQTSAKLVNMAETLKADLEAAGVDTEATLLNGKPRFVWLTWGLETAVSEYQYCSNVIFAGVLHRSDVDLAGAIVGQQDNLTVDVPYAEILEVRRSEIAHSLYQAMSRGSCRRTVHGEAVAMKAWLIHYDTSFRKLINRVMPGVVWKEWEAKYLQAKTSKIEDAARKIRGYLEGLSEEVRKVSTMKLKKEVGAKDIPSQTWKYALRSCLEETPYWTLEGRSVARIACPFPVQN